MIVENKTTIAQKAQAHTIEMNTLYPKETALSIARTEIYGGPDKKLILTPPRKTPFKPTIALVAKDSVQCAFSQPYNEGRTALLNFADYIDPGGTFLGGGIAQEEDLCHASNLYSILAAFEDRYYAWNRFNDNDGLYEHRALYTPDVIFTHYGLGTKKIDVLTCAAPNLAEYAGEDKAEVLQTLRDRIRFMYEVVRVHEVDTLIAGAWGCGVFKCDPWIVSRLLVNEASSWLKKIYFAIPDEESENYKVFKDCVNNYV